MHTMEERIQKIMAAAGIASRRAAEEIILEGRVRVNGAVVTELGAKADPDKDHIKVDGKLINPKQPKTYLMLNKPAGCVTTMFDPEGRPTVTSLLKGVKTRVYPVGRLDYDTEGLLLLTNDGDFAFRITHPSHELPKTYHVKIKGVLEDRQIANLEEGVFLKDGKTAPARVKKLRKEEANSWVEITIHEGRKRQVRRMIDHTGRSVIKLKRVRVGNLGLGDLPLGSFRHLTLEEVKALTDMALGGESARAEEQAKPSRKPAAAGHVPEFVEGPKPRARAPRKEAFGGSELPRRPEGGERTFEKKAWRPEPRGVRQDSRGAGPGQLRSARPSFRSEERPFTSRAPRTGDRFDARKGPGRPFGSRPPRTGDSFDANKGPGRSFSSRPASREQGDRPFSSRPPRTDDRFDARKGPGRPSGTRPPSRESGSKPFRSAAPRTDARYGPGTKPGRSFGARPAPREQGDRPFRRPDERTGAGARPGGGRPFPASRTRTQERGPRPEGTAPRPAGRTEWQRDSRSRGPAPFAGERGPRKSRPAPGAGDRQRSRPGAPARPAGTFPRGPKGPARRRS